MSEKKVCPKHNVPLQYYRKRDLWYCPECLKAAFLTAEAQSAAQKRYQDTPGFKASQDKYIHSEKGQKARTKYFKGPKYKEARKKFNQNLKESLAIARQAHLERASIQKPVETTRTQELAPLIQDIREYIDTVGHKPTHQDVTTWASDVYGVRITDIKATELIQRAAHRR